MHKNITFFFLIKVEVSEKKKIEVGLGQSFLIFFSTINLVINVKCK